MNSETEKSLQMAGLLDYFNSLPPSHQKEYLIWINEAKKSETQANRILKTIEMLKAKQN
jgi:uncharacterized protein YdeI (YjbR/CyaY-like superfamily)